MHRWRLPSFEILDLRLSFNSGTTHSSASAFLGSASADRDGFPDPPAPSPSSTSARPATPSPGRSNSHLRRPRASPPSAVSIWGYISLTDSWAPMYKSPSSRHPSLSSPVSASRVGGAGGRLTDLSGPRGSGGRVYWVWRWLAMTLEIPTELKCPGCGRAVRTTSRELARVCERTCSCGDSLRGPGSLKIAISRN
jgi:hypothetical protein